MQSPISCCFLAEKPIACEAANNCSVNGRLELDCLRVTNLPAGDCERSNELHLHCLLSAASNKVSVRLLQDATGTRPSRIAPVASMYALQHDRDLSTANSMIATE
ncbi:hypothetical protein [Mesorhizobium sp. 43Arga]